MGCSSCQKNKLRKMYENIQSQSVEWQTILREFSMAMVKWAKNGMPTVNSQVHAERYNKCVNCDKFKSYRCQLCGCVVYVKSKLATEACPEKKW